MKFGRIFLMIIMTFGIVSCSTSRKTAYKPSHKKTHKTVSKKTKKSGVTKMSGTAVANAVLNEAHKYQGVPYKFGGTTRTGMDCSGLVISAFDAVGLEMPRISRDQANAGKEIRLSKVERGDLVFFITSGSRINHVGIVDKIVNGEVFFIHSSSSKGVMISSLDQDYWKTRFVKATRVL